LPDGRTIRSSLPSWHRRLKSCRTCVVAAEPTWAPLHELWEACRLDSLVPAFETLEQAVEYVRSPIAGQ
jgi:hypothetical protein